MRLFQFDFRPRSVVEEFGEAHFHREGVTILRRDDGVEGNGSGSERPDGTIACSWYIWKGDVQDALKAEIEKLVGAPLAWQPGAGAGNGHGGGVLVPVKEDS